MRLSDPFTGWRNGWIGRGAFAGWLAHYVAISVALAVLLDPQDVGTGATGAIALRAVIFLCLDLPFLNLVAKRARDAGFRGWLEAGLVVIACWLGRHFLSAAGFFGVMAGLLIGLACMKPDAFGSRVERDPVDPETFT